MDTNTFINLTPIFNIVSTMAYMIGIEAKYFTDDQSANFEQDIYESLEQNKHARLIRCLCSVRSDLIKYFSKIQEKFKNGYNLAGIPEYISPDVLNYIEESGIRLWRSKPDIYEYIVELNKEISSKLFYSKEVFPEWFEWDYIKDLFLMPGGTKAKNVKKEIIKYSQNKNLYPFQTYINWQGKDVGNILHNDEKFALSVYELHEIPFTNTSLVRKVGKKDEYNIKDFISASENLLIVVDCENADPVKFAGFLMSLSVDEKRQIQKIMLYNSDYTTAEWDIMFEEYMKEYISEKYNIKRLYTHKSQVDMSLAVDTTREIYQNGIDSVILVSSDSDYWAMINSLSETNFMMLIEAEKSGRVIRETLENNGYKYCFIDNFYTGSSYAIKMSTIKRLVQKKLDENMINIEKIVNDSISATYSDISEGDRKHFYDTYIRKASLELTDSGELRIVLGAK